MMQESSMFVRHHLAAALSLGSSSRSQERNGLTIFEQSRSGGKDRVSFGVNAMFNIRKDRVIGVQQRKESIWQVA